MDFANIENGSCFYSDGKKVWGPISITNTEYLIQT